jgi:hypothetical protein
MERKSGAFAATQLFTFRPQEQSDRTLTSLLADEWRLHLRRTCPSRRRIVPPSKVSMGNIVCVQILDGKSNLLEDWLSNQSIVRPSVIVYKEEVTNGR